MKKHFFSFLLLLSSILSVSGQAIQGGATHKFEEFGELPCEDQRGRLDNFLVYLRNLPDARGFVIVYEGKYSRPIYDDRRVEPEYRAYLPAVGEARYRMRVMKSHFKFRKFPTERISIIEGGFRENFTVEFWIVPAGEKPPAASPTLDKMKYRKGKPARIVCET